SEFVGHVQVQSARRRSAQAPQVASNALEHPPVRPWRTMSCFYGMYFRNAAEEAQVPRLGSGLWWRVAAYSGCKVFITSSRRRLGSRSPSLANSIISFGAVIGRRSSRSTRFNARRGSPDPFI